MHPYIFLSIAIAGEVVATTALKSSDGFTKLWPSAIAVISYIIAFYNLSLALRTIPTGIAYAIWCGFGIVMIALADYALHGTKLVWTAYLGMFFIFLGTALMHFR